MITMTTNRELLKLAAKVAGLGRLIFSNGLDDDGYDNGVLTHVWYRDATGTLIDWNPLEDDGDALRLAVKLMEFEPYKSRGYLPCITSDAQDTRRAIVRAAAEIGKEMT